MGLIEKLTGLADSIRAKTETTEKLTIDQMMDHVNGIEVMPETIVLVDEDGIELPAVRTDEYVTLTATANDIRRGTTAVIGDGIVEGTKEIPIYHSTEGSKVITNGSKFILPIKNFEYTKLQAIICAYNTNYVNSVGAVKVVINSNVYPVQSTEAESAVTINTEDSYIDFGITNTSGKPCLIRYFTFKEIY